MKIKLSLEQQLTEMGIKVEGNSVKKSDINKILAVKPSSYKKLKQEVGEAFHGYNAIIEVNDDDVAEIKVGNKWVFTTEDGQKYEIVSAPKINKNRIFDFLTGTEGVKYSSSNEMLVFKE